MKLLFVAPRQEVLIVTLAERIHAVANLGLQSVGMMRQQMSPDMKLLKKNCNSNNELRKATKRHDGLKEALNESPSVSIDLLK